MTTSPKRRRRHAGAAVALTAASTVVAACATTAPSAQHPGGAGTTITVVAAENFWGSIASQLGGEHARVSSIISNPQTDPHDYQPTPADGRAVADARYAIVNGIGYDEWAGKLISASGNRDQTVLTVGDLVGVRTGGNPHRWYSPADVHRVIAQITADYQRIDPADAGYFDQRRQQFENQDLAEYTALAKEIRTKYAGTPIGASESIFSPLATDLGLTLATPQSFVDAISQGAEPTAADKAAIDAQITHKQIKVYLHNSQNSTPDVKAQVDAAKAAGIPVVEFTETPTPADATFQAWQTAQLRALANALAQATGH